MKRLWAIGGMVAAGLVFTGLRLGDVRMSRLPYQDGFARNEVAEWMPYGGSWRVEGDAIAVSADESGAKLSLDGRNWTNYQIWSDVELEGHNGDVQIALRVSDVALGEEAIRGYLVSLREPDAGLEITRAAQAMLSLAPVRLPGGVNTGNWYRLHAVIVNCGLAVEATNLESGATAYTGFQDSPRLCLRRGGVALRTTSTAAAWRRVRIAPANETDLIMLNKHVSQQGLPAYPIQERAYSAMRAAYLAQVPTAEIHRPISLETFGPDSLLDSAELVSVVNLRSQVWNTEPVRIVGVITSADPLYLQDPTGGVRLQETRGVSFRPGDEVEMLGRPALNGALLQFQATAGRFTSDRVAMVPLSVTATQAATGRYDGALIEVNGTVRGSRTSLDGGTTLLLEDDGQRFTARLPYDVFHGGTSELERDSRVQVRGVCSMDRSDELHRGAFVLYTTSSNNVMLLEGPPWWTGERLFWILMLCFVFAIGGIALHGAVERAKLRVVQIERERLSHDLHDTLAQSLAGVGFRLQGVHRSLACSGAIPPQHLDDLKTACDLLANAHREASSNIAALHPPSQEEGDVLRMLERAVYSMLEDKDFPVVVAGHGTPRPLSPVVTDMLYRVGREAIANALRHAQAQSIKVQMTYRSRDVMLTVTDDGTGFAVDMVKPGFGTRTMMRRCEAINARFTIVSAPGSGCRVQVVSPYRVRRRPLRWGSPNRVG